MVSIHLRYCRLSGSESTERASVSLVSPLCQERFYTFQNQPASIQYWIHPKLQLSLSSSPRTPDSIRPVTKSLLKAGRLLHRPQCLPLLQKAFSITLQVGDGALSDTSQIGVLSVRLLKELWDGGPQLNGAVVPLKMDSSNVSFSWSHHAEKTIQV